jgi:hypothetical protein
VQQFDAGNKDVPNKRLCTAGRNPRLECKTACGQRLYNGQHGSNVHSAWAQMGSGSVGSWDGDFVECAHHTQCHAHSPADCNSKYPCATGLPQTSHRAAGFCANMGMRLPSVNEMQNSYFNTNQNTATPGRNTWAQNTPVNGMASCGGDGMLVNTCIYVPLAMHACLTPVSILCFAQCWTGDRCDKDDDSKVTVMPCQDIGKIVSEGLLYCMSAQNGGYQGGPVDTRCVLDE